MRAMIMAAGLGTRLMPLTAAVPKPMVPIVGRPAVGHILDLLRHHGIDEVVMNLHHFPDTIRDGFGDGSRLGMSIEYSYEEELLGTAGGVKNNQSFLDGGTFVVMSGDSLTDVDLTRLVAQHRDSGGIATLGVTPVDDTTEYGVVVVDERGRVLGFQEKPAPEDALSRLCNCGIYVFEPEVFDHIPAGAFYDFGRQVFFDLLDEGLPFHAHDISGYWSDVGGLDAYREGNFDALRGKVVLEALGGDAAAAAPADGTAPAPRRFFAESSVVAPTAEFEGPVYVGPGCSIGEGAVITGPVVVGAGTRIGARSRVTQTVLWEECRLGPDCLVEAGLMADRVHVEAGAHIARAVLGEGCRVSAGRRVEDLTVDPGTTV